MGYTERVAQVFESDTFRQWRSKLKDRVAVARITARIARLSNGYFGDTKYLRDSIRELRIDHGPGYRVYFTQRGAELILLLAGGDKTTQAADIDRAIKLSESWRPET